MVNRLEGEYGGVMVKGGEFGGGRECRRSGCKPHDE